MTTINDIAKKASVGIGTVSRVLSGKGSVSDKTRQRVLKVMADLNYRPNSVARSLATRQTNSIGLMVPVFHGRYFGRLITSAERNFRQDGRQIMVARGFGGASEETGAVDYLRDRECDGLILYSTEMSDEALMAFVKSYPNVALLNRPVAGLDAHCFTVDHRHGGALAAQHLLKCGHRRIACITGPRYVADAVERQAGFEAELARAGIDTSELIKLEGDYNYASGAMCMEHLWTTRRGQFTALFCGNDDTAIGAFFKLAELGAKVPEDLSIIGYDDTHLASHTFPRLTTVFNPIEEIADNAASFVRNLCYKQQNKVQNVFGPRLIARDSVRAIG